MEQIFIKELKGNFNLRRPRSTKPTPIYYVVYMDGIQHYFATGVKVYPSQWDKKKQIAVVSNTQSKLDNQNNGIVNSKLNLFTQHLLDYKTYLCNNPQDLCKAGELLNLFFNKKTIMKQNKKGTEILVEALEYYYDYIAKKPISPNTVRQSEYNLGHYIKYIKEQGISDDAKILTQEALNNYKKYLQDESKNVENGKRGGGNDSINHKCQIVTLLINKVICCENDFLKYKVSPVKYNVISESREQKEKCRFALTEEEVIAIKGCSGLPHREEIYRDIFVLQIETGQRVSDLIGLLNHQFTKETKEDTTYYILKTKKEKTTAYIEETPFIKHFFEKYKDGYEDINLKTMEKNGFTYNRNIRSIAKKAGLNREVSYKDSRGNEHTKMIHEILCSHDARHTFATLKLKDGYDAKIISKMTGHKDEKMVNTIYGHKDNSDIAGELFAAKQRMEGKYFKMSKSTKESDSTIAPLFINHLNEELIKNIYKMIKTNKRVLIKELPDTNRITFDENEIVLYIQEQKATIINNRPLVLKRMVEIDNMLNVINRRFGGRFTIMPFISLVQALK